MKIKKVLSLILVPLFLIYSVKFIFGGITKVFAEDNNYKKAQELFKQANSTVETNIQIELFNRALEICNDYLDVYSNLGDIYKKRKDYANAIKYYSYAIKIAPDYNAYINLGDIYQEKGDIENAKQFYLDAQWTNPTRPEPYFKFGDLYFEKQHYGLAVDFFKNGLIMDNANEYYTQKLVIAKEKLIEQGNTIKSNKVREIFSEKVPIIRLDFPKPFIPKLYIPTCTK